MLIVSDGNLMRTLCIATENMESLVEKTTELVYVLCRRNVDVVGLQEVISKNQQTKTLKGEDCYYHHSINHFIFRQKHGGDEKSSQLLLTGKSDKAEKV